MSAQYTYLVRCRDVLNGTEQWLKDEAGNPVVFDDRLAADLAALLVNQKGKEWQYAQVTEMDLNCEDIIA